MMNNQQNDKSVLLKGRDKRRIVNNKNDLNFRKLEVSKSTPGTMKRTPAEVSKTLTKSYSQYNMDSNDLEIINPDRISRFYEVPSEMFKTSDEIVSRYGYKIGSKLSEGGFAKVFKAVHVRTGLEVACKIVELGKKLPELKPRAAEARDMKNELYIMSRMNNRYIMRLYAHFVINNHIFIFMKLANSGTLFNLIKDGGPAQESECRYFMGQLLVGLEHMHEQSIAHKDLKLENVLLTRDKKQQMHVLITDFGLSRIIRLKADGNYDMIKSFCGTPTYMAPEQLSNKSYCAFTSDIWSLGVVIYSAFSAQFPFDSSKRNLELMEKKAWAPFPSKLTAPTPQMMQVIEGMLEPEPTKRIRLSTLVRHPWIVDDYSMAKSLCLPKPMKNAG